MRKRAQLIRPPRRSSGRQPLWERAYGRARKLRWLAQKRGDY